MNVIFPFGKIPQNSNVIIYGAGMVGEGFIKQIITSNYCKLIGILDRKFHKKQLLEQNIEAYSPDEFEFEKIDFDFIVISVLDKKTYINIKKFLIDNNVDEKKIFWEEYTDLDLIDVNNLCIYDSYADIERIIPNELVTKDNLDLMVRYLLIKDIKNGINNVDHLNLYMQYWMILSNLIENKSGLQDSKSGEEDFLKSINELVESMQNNGFIETSYIPVDLNFKMINGKHRCASALALEEEIWIKRLAHIEAKKRDFKWFLDNGFNINAQCDILRAYADLYNGCNIAVLFGIISENWDLVIKQFEKHMSVVGYLDLDFSNDYISFENVIRDIYGDILYEDPWKDRKVRLLRFGELKLRIVLLSNENFKDTNIYAATNEVKKSIRNMYSLALGHRKDNISIHAADNYEEYLLLKKTLLSKNNLKHISMRITKQYSFRFIDRLNQLKNVIKSNGIDLNCICIVGSAVLELFGLRESNDIDFIATTYVREKIDGMKLFDWCGKKSKDSLKVAHNKIYKDDVVIEDHNLHFIFNELKFVNIDIMYERYQFLYEESGDMKSLEDVKLLSLFKQYVKWFDDKKILQERLLVEANRNR